MRDKEVHQNSNPTPPRQIRVAVSKNNQIHLPHFLINEVGFTTSIGPKVVWYYHDRHDKAVLSDNRVDRSSLEKVKSMNIAGMTNEDLDGGPASGARITIPNELPEDLYRKLTLRQQGKPSAILKPIYAANRLINSTCISVYPALAFENGKLPNVEFSSGVELDSPQDEAPIGSYDSHMNSI